MKKIEIEIEVPYSIEWNCYTPLNSLKHDIEQLEKLGVTHVSIEHGVDYYNNSSITMKALIIRMETDEELKKRKKNKERYDEELKQNDLMLYERIKSKYKL